MKSDNRKVIAAALASAALLAAGAAAAGTGCNGVVSTERYCSARESNNGPQFPHYRPPLSSLLAPSRASTLPPLATQQLLATPRGNGIISDNSAGLLGDRGAGILSDRGAGLTGAAGLQGR